MEIEYVTVGVDPQVTEYIVEQTVETSFSPTHVKTEPDQDFNENNSQVSCPTLVTEQIKLEPDAGYDEPTYVYFVQNAPTDVTETSHKQEVCDAKEGQPAEVLYQIKDETEESDSEASGCGWLLYTPAEVGLADAELVHGQGVVQVEDESYICTECGKRFKGKESMLKHLQEHAQGVSHNCTHCEQKFPDSGSLLRHVQCEHTRSDEYHCSLCGIRFQAAKAFAKHMKIHSGEDQFVCSVCGKNFRHRSSLWRHQHTHRLEEDSLIECGYSSASSSSSSTSNSSSRTIPSPVASPKLVIHEPKTAPKSFLCVKCGKRFNHSSSLSRHRLTHLEEKKPSPSSAKGHKNTPPPKQPLIEQGKPFRCSHCSKYFAHSSSLYRHMQTHEQRPYQCSLCHKGFLKLSALSSHQKCHQDRKSCQDRKVHSCFECGKSFNHSSSLSRHRHSH